MPLDRVKLVKLSEKRRILKNRVLLIRAIEKWLGRAGWDNSETKFLSQALARIRADTNRLVAFEPASDGVESGVSYSDIPSRKWNCQLRTVSNISHYLRKIEELDSNMVSDRTLENLRYALATCGVDFTSLPITIVRGKDISEAYRSGKYGDSCMTGDKASYVEMYELSPDKVGMVLYNGMARALLWTTDEGDIVMDRIYPNSGSHVRIMQQWAELQGYLYRLGTEASAYSLSADKRLHVTLFINNYRPYFDTFRFIQYLGRKTPEDKRWIRLCNCEEKTPAGMAITGFVSCGVCGLMLWEDYDRHYTSALQGPYCEECFALQFTLCAKCLDVMDINSGMWMTDGTAAIGEFWCAACVATHTFTCHHCGAIYSDDCDVVITEEGNTICIRCINAGRVGLCTECHAISYGFYTMVNKEEICENCFHMLCRQGNIGSCPRCGSDDRIEKGYREEKENGRWFCSECREKVPSYKKRKKEATQAGAGASASKPAPVVIEL